MTFISPCCCALSLVSVKTLWSWHMDKCVDVLLFPCSPYTLFFFSSSDPPHQKKIVSVSPFLWVTDWVQWQPQQESHIEQQQRELWLTLLCVCMCDNIMCTFLCICHVYFFCRYGGVFSCTLMHLSHKQIEDFKHWIAIRFTCWDLRELLESECMHQCIFCLQNSKVLTCKCALSPNQTQSLVTFESKSSDRQMTSFLKPNRNAVTSALMLYQSNEVQFQVNGDCPVFYNRVTFNIN